MVSRRQLLLSGLSLVGGAAALSALPGAQHLWQSITTPSRRVLLLGEQRGEQWYISALRLDTYYVHRVALPFQPHSYVQDPDYSHRVWAIEKWGGNASLVDLHDLKIVRTIPPPEGSYFFGHGFFYPGTRIMFFSCVDRPLLQGGLLGVDADQFSVQQNFNMVRANVHDGKMLPDGTALIASSGSIGGEAFGPNVKMLHSELPALVRCNPLTGKVLNKITVADRNQMLSHFALFGDGRVVALSRGEEKGGRVYTGSIHAPSLQPVELGDLADSDGTKEMLSVAVDGNASHALVTAAGGGKLLLVDARNGTYGGATLVKPDVRVRSLAYDPERNQFIAAGRDGLYGIPVDVTVDTLASRASLLVGGNFGGSHSKIITL